MRPEFLAVVEAPHFDGNPPWQWPIAKYHPFEHFRVHGGMTAAETGSFVATLCDSIEVSEDQSPSDVITALLACESLHALGGLAIKVGSEYPILPGCCSGLEDWRDLLVLIDRKSPWMGHDPDPWCEYNDQVARFWSTGGVCGEKIEPFVDVPVSELSTGLNNFQRDLQNMLGCLHQWLQSNNAPTEFVKKVDASFSITTMEAG